MPWRRVRCRAPGDRLWARAAGDLIRLLDELERRALVARSPTHYRFSHELIRRACYDGLGSARRRLLHARIARTRRALRLAPAASADIALHAHFGADAALAVRATIAAGEHCLRLLAFADAERFAELGRHHVAELSGAQSVSCRLALLKILLYPGVRLRKPEHLTDEIMAVCTEARERGMVTEMSEAMHLLGWIYHLTWNDFPRARAAILAMTRMLDSLPTDRHLEVVASSAR